MAVDSEHPVKFPKRLTPLKYGSARVIYDADVQHEGIFESKRRANTVELRESTLCGTLPGTIQPFLITATLFPRKPGRLNLDAAKTDRKWRPNTDRLQARRGRTANLAEAVGSVRIPNISVPCFQVVRSFVKSARTPGSAGSAKGKEPYFEILTPAAFDLTFEKTVESDDGDSDATSGAITLEDDSTSLGESLNLPPSPDEFSFPEERLPNPHSTANSPISLMEGSLRDSFHDTESSSAARPVEHLSTDATITAHTTRAPVPKPPLRLGPPAQSPPVSTNAPLRKVPRPLPTPPIAPSRYDSSRTVMPKALPPERGLPPLPSRRGHTQPVN
ncbi:hypothetical protein E1B28_006340 [Marasmius oreades]|uniref:Uncharacterized protein n=1 Tax=Marasmius oreades TaxID=181124 RepID=A0A9P7UVP8_9AGAR|nr:uncharacterized protein E1B28_006340 [Marasmius oreades]KAG7095615.1 hypothetical protein E1B28_006340 [Marasmius oreades]